MSWNRQARIALIHATPLAMEPVAFALQRNWPDAEAVNLLDDSLTVDRSKTDHLSIALTERILGLADYARGVKADGVLFTCSAFGAAIEAANDAGPQPVLKPNEAMFEAALKAGERIAMLYTFKPAGPGMLEEFDIAAAHHRSTAQLTPYFVDGAIDALRHANTDEHNRLVAQAATSLKGYDAILLAHFSTSRALDAVRQVTEIPVLTAPDAAVIALQERLKNGAPDPCC